MNPSSVKSKTLQKLPAGRFLPPPGVAFAIGAKGGTFDKHLLTTRDIFEAIAMVLHTMPR
jgi:hypothetical protein